MNWVGTLVPDPNMLMFTDEPAKDERTTARWMGWSRIGTQCVQWACFVHGHCYSILPVLTLEPGLGCIVVSVVSAIERVILQEAWISSGEILALSEDMVLGMEAKFYKIFYGDL